MWVLVLSIINHNVPQQVCLNFTFEDTLVKSETVEETKSNTDDEDYKVLVEELLNHESFKTKGSKSTSQKKRKRKATHQCTQCDYVASQKRDLDNHFVSAHAKSVHRSSDLLAIQTRDSETVTTSGINLGAPIQRVKKPRPFECPQCEYAATQLGNLQTHIRSKHDKIRPHECTLCEFSATQAVNLRTHISAVHKKIRPHKCPHCEYAAAQPGNLQNHVRSAHLKIKPYQCPFCEYTACQASTVKGHIKRLHSKQLAE